ncbi:MAG: 5'/3'-nucleotidase SurE [Phycisphaerales bacterium]|nr:MAG: 5'/3'-nucleotidase SurE [Phycisphaerales bacterium]
MHILLTNDDGIFAPGLAAIYRQLCHLGDVVVVAPTDSQSGASHSVTFFEPLGCTKVEIEGLFTGFGVHGSPADCVKLAVMQLHEKPFDLVVAGINNGANVGINVYYSGTVAAAMEAAFLGIPSVALSLAAEREMDFDRAAKHGLAVLKQLAPLEPGDVINVNIPRLSRGKPKKPRVVPQATGGFEEYYIPQQDGASETVFQLAGGAFRPEAIATDTSTLSEGHITITPLRADMTDHEKAAALQARLGQKQS